MPYTVWKGGRTTTAFEQHRYERLEADAIRAEIRQKFEQLTVVRNLRKRQLKAELELANMIKGA